VETNGTVAKKEIPFVMGVMGDYSGDNTKDKKALKDRKFSQIDRDNFNDIMAKTAPKLDLKVENTLAGDGSEMSVALDFNHMEDFEPHKIVDQVEPLKKLLETRDRLRDLLSKADRSEELEDLLENILNNTEALSSLSGELGVESKNNEGDQ
jgi:type VI secretion system protein ImpB